MCDCFRKLDAFFSELFLVRQQAAIYYFGEMLYILQLSGKTLLVFGCHILGKKRVLSLGKL